MAEISKSIFLSENILLGAFYKARLDPDLSLMELSRKLGADPGEFDRDEDRIALLVGIGRTSEDTFDRIAALMYGESTFFVGDGCDLNGSTLRVGAVSGFIYDPAADEGKLSTKFEADALSIELSAINASTAKALIGELASDVEYGVDDNDNEYVLFRKGRESSLNKLRAYDNGVFVQGWDDLDDLAELSKVWDFAIRLESTG